MLYLKKMYEKDFQNQGLTITIKLLYMIMYVCQNFGICDIDGQISKGIYQASYLWFSGFSNSFSEAHSYLNRMKDC